MKANRNTLIRVTVLLLIVNVSSVLAQEQADPVAVRGEFARALDEQDAAKIESLFAEDGVFDYVVLAVPLLDSNVAVAAFFADLFNGSPDTHTTEGRIFSKENIVVVEHNVLGTNTGESSIPTTGNAWDLPHIDIFEIEGEKIRRLTTYADYFTVMVQLGMAPAPEPIELIPSLEIPDPEPTGLSPWEANAELVTRWNSHDPGEVTKMVHQDATLFYGPLGGTVGRTEGTAMNEIYFQGFSDTRLDPVRTIDLGDGWILSEHVGRGTHDGMFMGVPASGYPMEVRTVWLNRFDADGLLTHHSVYYDNLTFMTQMTSAPWLLDGIWVSSVPTPFGNLIGTTVYVAQDEAQTQYSGTLEWMTTFLLFEELYPDSDPSLAISAGGQANRVGRNTYSATFLEYQRKKDLATGAIEIVGLDTVDAHFTLVGPDLLRGHGTASYYVAEQDADQDGFPDEGQEPIICLPWAWTAKRLTAVPGCLPAPMPGQ